MLSETLRSRWFSAVQHAASWLLLVLVLTNIGGKRPRFEEARPDPTAVTMPVPVAKLEHLFPSVTITQQPVTLAGSLNPFYTAHFQPQAAPPPPTPTTRIIALTYQGFYQTGDGPKRAMIRYGDSLVSVPVGSSVVTNLLVAAATPVNLTLTNPATGQTNLLVLNTKKEIEIPIQ